jgi:hypothetical protein
MNTREGRGATRSVLPAVLARRLVRCRPPAAAAADVAAAACATAPRCRFRRSRRFRLPSSIRCSRRFRSPGIHYIVISRAGSVGAPAVGNVTCSTILAIAAVVGGAAGAATDAVSIEAGRRCRQTRCQSRRRVVSTGTIRRRVLCSVLSEASTQQDMHDIVHNARDCPLCTVLAARSAVETSPTQLTTVLSSRKSSHLAGMWGLLPRRH